MIDYFNEVRFVAWIAMIAAVVSVILLIFVIDKLGDINEKMGSKSKAIDEDQLAEAVAAKLAKFAKRPANQPPPAPKD